MLFLRPVTENVLNWNSPSRRARKGTVVYNRSETGDTWEGKPYDYVHFEGKNPRYNEQMQPVDSRALWERHIRR